MHHLIQKLRLFFDLSQNSPATNRAIFDALGKQVPLMYLIAVVNMFALTYVHIDVAPKPLTLFFPCALLLIAIIRSTKLMRAKSATFSDELILRKLNVTIILATIIGFGFSAWSLSLFQYGDAFMKVHVALFVGVMVIGCTFCLMHLKQAAVLLTVTSVVPSSIVFMVGQGDAFLAITVNILLSSGAMLYVLLRHNLQFSELIDNQETLVQQRQELQSLNSENIHLANMDSLTHLPNRRNFFTKLSGLIEAPDSGNRVVVGLIDLDGFKPINDIFGHAAGDQLLIETGERLRDILDDDIFLARLGGDEFALIITTPRTDDELLAIGEDVCSALREPFDIREGQTKISGTMGFATYPDAAQSSDLLFERADYALCYSKKHSKGTPVLFSADHETIIREVSNIEHRLREADLEEELSVVFQPIVDTDNNVTVGMEALARWKSPILGNVPPDSFIRSAERAGSIGALTLILLKKALKSASHWPDDIFMSFNLSALDLSSPDSILRLMRIVQDSDFSAHRVVFEITESAMMQDFDRADESLQLIRLTGATIALDDFGTGYSSLSYVQRMPIDRLKIDRSFVEDIDQNKATRDIVRSVIDLCRNLDLKCVVEGVETQEQLDALRKIGCKLVQGYFFSKPLNALDALAFLNTDLPGTLPATSGTD